MFFGFHLFRENDAFDDAFFVDDEGSTECAHILASVHTLFSPYSELFYQFLVCIGNEGERKFVLGNELLVRFGIVHTYTNNLITGLAECCIIITQVAGLRRAARRTVLG